jgi:hypothetical protein
MRIDLAAIDRACFFVRPASHPVIGSLVQIAPQKSKHRWSADELHLRSLLTRPDGTVVSSGFPKFFNVGEDEAQDAITAETVGGGAAWFTEKLDGSLLIRDVIDGVVLLRTRGSAALSGPRGERAAALVARSAPALLDPAVLPGCSLLFEYLSDHPDDRIILRHDRPRLVALGWMRLNADRLPIFEGTPEVLAAMTAALGVPGVPLRSLPADLDAAAAIVRDWPDSEGVVVRAPRPDGGMHLAKIKALSYLLSHAAQGHLTAERLRRLCWAEGITTEAALVTALHARGVDWEVLHLLRAPLAEWLAHRADVLRRVADFTAAVDALAALPTLGDRARRLQVLCAEQSEWGALFGLGMARLRGQDEAEHVGALIMRMTLSQFRQFTREGLAEARDLSPRMPGG